MQGGVRVQHKRNTKEHARTQLCLHTPHTYTHNNNTQQQERTQLKQENSKETKTTSEAQPFPGATCHTRTGASSGANVHLRNNTFLVFLREGHHGVG